MPAGHRLADAGTIDLARLDGERLLAWSPAGTPYTDLLVARLAAAGARVEPVESRVTGGQSLTEPAPTGAVAIVPEGWPARDGTVLLGVRDDLTLPLVALWATGMEPPAVRRLRAAL